MSDDKYRDNANSLDYGWRFQSRSILCMEDRSNLIDESAYHMHMALSQMSQEFYYTERCLQCGICTEVCPFTRLNTIDKFSPREFIQRLRLGLLDLSGEDLWYCTNCGSCEMVCPFEIPFVKVMSSLRNLVVKQGAGYLPATLKNSISSLSTYNNPWMEDPDRRSDWMRGIDIPAHKKNSPRKILLFIGCFPSYDVDGKRIARSAVRLLNRVNINFETLGNKEVCCGDSSFRSGDSDGFEKLKNINTSNFAEKGIRYIYTLSPHCFDVMSKWYFKDNEYHVKPFILLIHELISSNILKLKKPINKRIAFHDPCFLCKHNKIIDEPREILKSISGAEFVEMEHCGAKSMCCGGGGGGVFLDRKKGERLSEIRLDEAVRSGADILVTACPLCLSMLGDSAKSDDRYSDIRIMDICELVLEAV
ncbi:MAG TPA: (Fe-S)-binding protein [Syntrophorhabdus sp.]|nr:(Fe-S)-binding protein [Syntrophorhabdus sp.]